MSVDMAQVLVKMPSLSVIGNLTVSGHHNGAAAGTWDVKQQAKLTVTGNMFLHSGTLAFS